MKTNFLEYDIVRSTRALGTSIPSKTEGAILMVFDSTNPQYEVEFIGDDGDSLAVMTVEQKDLELVVSAK